MTSFHAYRARMQAQGRTVIPADVRADLGLDEGEELIILKTENGYRLTSRRELVQELQGSLKKTGDAVGRDFTQELLDERRAEAAKKGW